jgi:hypothetical protein
MAKVKNKEAKKQFKGQYDDEELLLVFRKHPIVMRKGLILLMIAILIGTIPSFIKPEFSYLYGGLAAGFLLGIIIAFPSWIYWYFSTYIMTSQRFIQITQKGFFHRTVSDIGVKHIQSVNYQVAGVQETLLGYGSILIQTYLGDILINDVHHPEKIMNELFGVLREYGNVTEHDADDMAAKTRHQ